ncbi:multicopper oxidase family protein [Actinomadura nitritigenes]|uniref:Multicopper oxidase family protein n=1 Tax=Actinomadura nitritigenes TaxID=134602 RepID=A0ABS3RF99_9ACTN|nr:multicopper oxidase family protein [Actinomadura nitritigenes]MBO2444532.1 multicopper oxidase family protein [Actinomadura nitritigenes]
MNPIDRRSVLRAGLLVAGGAALAACGGENRKPSFIAPDGEQVRKLEAARRGAGGAVRDFQLTPAEGTIDLGGRTVRTWTYGQRLPGAEIRVKAGEVVRARVANALPTGTTVHWHGVALHNGADGVPGVTQSQIKPGAEYVYEFAAPDPGTYWLHPHVGTQLDRGLYAPLIVEDPKEPLSYDAEWVVVLDDWLDGVTGTPDQVLAELSKGMGGMGSGGGGDHSSMPGMDMPGMDMGSASPSPGSSGTGGHMLMGAQSTLLGGDAGDVRYPYFLVNGRLPGDPETFRARPGDRVRIRFVNAGGDTAFRVALGGHRMTVTHTDGFPVQPVETDALLIGMGERYDVLVTVTSGAFPLAALAEGKNAAARAVLRTDASAGGPAPDVRPRELNGKIVGYGELRPSDSARLEQRRTDRTLRLELTGGMMKYDWAINGRAYDPEKPYPVRRGERVRLAFVNRTAMWHPMHLHGHTFAMAPTGVRKDTAIVPPNTSLYVDFDADNPGRWMVHCHNVYHGESGMMALLGYQV